MTKGLRQSHGFDTARTYAGGCCKLVWSHATSMIGQVPSTSIPSHQPLPAVFDPRSDVLNMYKGYDVVCGRA